MGRKQKQRQAQSGPRTTNPVHIGQLIQQALYFQQNGYLNNAESIYKDILKSYPNHPDCLHFIGMLYHQRGDHQDALQYIEKSIRINKANPIYYNNFGLVLSKHNRLDDAVQAYKEAIALKSDYAEPWYNLGVARFDQGKLEESEQAYKEAIRIRPDYVKALSNLACVQEIQSKSKEAEDTLNKLLKISPDNAEVYNTLGAALLKLGGNHNLKQAEQYFLDAIRLRPDYLEAYTNLGSLYYEGNQLEEAIYCYTHALELEPEYVEAQVNLAIACVKNEQTDRAQELLNKVLEKHPHHPRALSELAEIKRYHGQFSDAEKQYKDVLRINPADRVAYYGLSMCRKYTTEDTGFVNQLKQLAPSAEVNYALGKIYNDIGNYDEAFIHYKKANDLRKNRVYYDAAEYTKRIDRIIKVFSCELVEQLAAGGNQSEIPVFILGTHRSGTTLTEQIISSHPGVFGAGELRYIIQIAKSLNKMKNVQQEYPECINSLSPGDISLMAADYLNRLKALAGNADYLRITDKLPENFRYIAFIFILFPRAKVIHCRRQPLDTCLSIYFQTFNNQAAHSFDLENLGLWYRDYLRLMEHWSRIFGDRIFHVQYDDLVNNTEETARKLVNCCGLDWDDRCLEFYKSRREVKTASQWQVRQPIYKTSLERWKKYDKHIGVLKEILAGYY